MADLGAAYSFECGVRCHSDMGNSNQSAKGGIGSETLLKCLDSRHKPCRSQTLRGFSIVNGWIHKQTFDTIKCQRLDMTIRQLGQIQRT